MRQQRSPRRGRPRAHSRPDRSVSSPAFESSSVEQSSDDGTVKQCNNDSENATSPLGDNRTADTLKVGERRTRSESDCEASGSFPGNSAGSSSNSSLSTRSLDSPSTSLEHVHPATSAANTSASWDSDVDVEPDPPDWSQEVSEEVLSRLSNSEKKRQEVINELFHTERSHVRALKVLSQVFHKPLLESQVLPLDQINLLFSNLDEMVNIHSSFNQAMKRKKKENPCVGDVGDLLLEMFDGEGSEVFERAASTYCAKQQVALDALRERRKKDTKLNSFLNEIEANPLCRRLQLKDHILTGMLRLTKYPLLFENLVKYTPDSNETEKAAVVRSLERSKEILQHVNQAVREAEDYMRLVEIQRNIDRTSFDKSDHPTVKEFKNFDITKRRLIFEGPLQCKIVKLKPVDLHVVLLDDTIFLLNRQDDKYQLKFINTNTNQANSVLSPIVKVSAVLVRHNATDKNSLYLVNTSEYGAQIYELVAATAAERKLWFKHISETAEAYKAREDREGRSRHTPPTSLPEGDNKTTEKTPPVAPLEPEVSVKAEPSQESKDSADHPSSSSSSTLPTVAEQEPPPETEEASTSAANVAESTMQQQQPTPQTPPQQQQKPQQPPQQQVKSPTKVSEPLRMVTCTQSSLIEPLEVHVEVRPVHVAEPVLTPIESLRRKDEVIRQALNEKQSLVADILNIPREDFEHVADIASEPTIVEKEPTELILAAINQANQLMGMLNSALNVTETETVLCSRGSSTTACGGCDNPGCPTPRQHPHPRVPTVTVNSLQPICNSLTTQLSHLLEIVKEREDERERLRKELRRSKERLHAIDSDAQKREATEVPSNSIETQTEPTEPEQPPSSENQVEESTKDEFVDAQDDSEATAKVENAEVKMDTEVMGDSVG